MDLPGTEPGTVFIGVARVELHIPGVGSLKGKRAVMNKLKAGLQRELGCSVAEVGFQDLWQRGAVGVAAAASSQTGAERVLDRIVAVIERDPRVVVTAIINDVGEVS
ncbi:MAG: DUF503 domain-containing protein [Actinomycetota bacterium]|nr:DUF503 domain-containing protein [Actinomycetota bacterium]